MKKKIGMLFGLVLGSAPVMAFAQTGQPAQCVSGIGRLLCKIQELLEMVVPILVTLGIIYFVWGIITYVIADDEEAKSAGRNRIIWGLVGLAVIVSMWGLVRILTTTAGVDNSTGGITLPTTP